MRIDKTARAGWLGLAAIILAPAWLAAQPAAPAGGESSSKIGHWVDMMKKAQDIATVVKARDGLINDYVYNASQGRGYAYADEAATKVTPLLTMKFDTLADAKYVNTAIALSQMPQVSIQPALEAMVVHPNPAVRLKGWEGYTGVRMLVLAQGERFADLMFKTLDQRAAREDSPLVIGAIFQMLQFPVNPPPSVPQQNLMEGQVKAMKILHDHWARWCRMVVGSVEMAQAAQKGAKAAANCYAIAPQRDDVKKQVVDMLASMMYAAAVSFDHAHAQGPVAGADTDLLREIEASLNTITQSQNKFVDDPLSKPNGEGTDKGAAVRLGVASWYDALKSYAPTQPVLKAPSASQPATAPSATSRPATPAPAGAS